MRITLVFILTLVLPTVLLSAFAYQAVEAERRARLAERAKGLQDRAEALVRELDEVVRVAGRRIGAEVAQLGELARPQEAGPRLTRSLPREAFVDGVMVLDPAGRRVWPVGRTQASPPAGPRLEGAALPGGPPQAGLAHDPAALLRQAEALGPGEREEALLLLERVARTAQGEPDRAAALYELGRLHQAGSTLPGTLNALEAWRQLAALPVGLIDARGRPAAAEARLRLALVHHLLRNRKAYLEALQRLIVDLEGAPELLPADALVDLAERAASLLEVEGESGEWLRRARALAARRRQEEQACARLEDLVASPLRRLRQEAPRPGEEPAFFKERAVERALLIACAALPGARGWAVVSLSEEALVRACRARVARVGQAELVPAARGERGSDPEVQEAALRPPLEHLGVRVRAPADEPELVEALGLPSDTVRLWAIALSIAGILAGVVVTVRTVRRESKAAQLKSDWVSNVTHELKTPLTSIRMFLDTLLLGRVTDEAEAKECLQVMSREAERLTRLIDQLLAFSRIESKKMRLRLGFESPRALVDEAIGILADQLGKRAPGGGAAAPSPGDSQGASGSGRRDAAAALGIEVVGVQDLPPIAVDRIAVVEAILNLLHNAWKYTPGPERRIRVVLAARRRMVEIAVEDNGIGVPRRDRRRIFVKFERGTNAEAARIEGSGIGLTVADTIVRAHGGWIECTPLRPEGSRFSIFLPK